MTSYYLAISLLCICSLLILSCIIGRSDAVSKNTQHFFRLSILSTITVFFSEILTVYLADAPAGLFRLSAFANFVGFAVAPFIPILIGCAIFAPTKRAPLLWVFPSINFILSFLSIFFPIVFSVSRENVYSRERFWWFFIVSYTLSLGELFWKTLVASRQYQNGNRYILYILFLFVVSGTSVQVLFPQLYLSWFCISFAIALYYIYFCELYHQIDGLTGLLNRQAYERCLDRIHNQKNAIIVIFDIDNFKSVNDQYGHLFGDVCLTSTASCIKSVFSKLGLCFRTGGDEFCVICESASESAVQLAYHRFLHKIISLRSTELRLPLVSIGYAAYNPRSDSIDKVISLADQRMYHFKETRKAETGFFPPSAKGEAADPEQFSLS